MAQPAQPPPPIQLPPPSTVQLPPAPQNPPTDLDFFNAVQYREDVRAAIGMGNVNPTVYRQASTYESAVHTRITEGANVMPDWAQTMSNNIMARFDAMDGRFDDIDNQLYELTVEAGESFTRINQSLSRVETLAAQTHNRTAACGIDIPFKQVPFSNGVLPSIHAPHLLILSNLTILSALTGQQATEYFQNYYPGTLVPHLIADRLLAIQRAVGSLHVPF